MANINCQAASTGPEGYCLAHLETRLNDVSFAARLELLVQGETLDVQGVLFTEDLLASLLRACPRNKAQAPVFEGVVRFDRATFNGAANFESAVFRQRVSFDGATFKGTAEFGEAIFEKEAEFHGVTFEGLARFSEATFNGLADFGSGDRMDAVSGGEDVTHQPVGVERDSLPHGIKVLARSTKENLAKLIKLRNGRRGDPAKPVANGQRGQYRAARFEQDARFRKTTFRGVARFSEATFEGFAEFGDDTHFERDAKFRKTTFRGVARFSEATFEGFAEFGDDTHFERDARFRNATFLEGVRFSEATFAGLAEFGHASVTKGARFRGATLGRARLAPFIARELVLDGAVFRQRPEIEAATALLSCKGTQFSDGAYLRLRWAKVVLDDADFAGPSILAGAPESEDEEFRQKEVKGRNGWPSDLTEQPWVGSLCRANVGGLVMSRVDLSECLFKDSHNLDKLRLEVSPKAFSAKPKRWRNARTRRQFLFEECRWRDKYEKTWRLPSCRDKERNIRARQEAREIANLYRSVRKGREDSKDEPGAADFYYGEMEMRRKAAPFGPERLILFLYWLLSGYALRAWRALVAFAVAIATFAVLFHIDGFKDPDHPVGAATIVSPAVVQGVSFAEVGEGLTTLDNWVFAIGTATSIAVGQETLLTARGRFYRVALRIIGPLLLALVVLSVRGRVKR